MKKFIVAALILIFAAMAGKAQSVTQLTPLAGDVLINAAVLNKALPQISSGNSGIAIGFTIVVNTGTGAGTAQLQGSYDNTNWFNIGAAYTILNATQSSQFIVNTPTPPWLRIVYGGGTTMNITIKTYYRAPRYQPTP